MKKEGAETFLSVFDVWLENYLVNSAEKVWAAKFAVWHPNVVILDLSSFKCGHDSPTYGIIDRIVERAAIPYSALHDIDANKPGGSIKIRVKTYAHSLKLHEERLDDHAAKKRELEQRIDEKRLELLRMKREELAARQRPDAAIEAQISELIERVAAYELDEERMKQSVGQSSGLISLGKKQADGSVVRVNA